MKPVHSVFKGFMYVKCALEILYPWTCAVMYISKDFSLHDSDIFLKTLMQNTQTNDKGFCLYFLLMHVYSTSCTLVAEVLAMDERETLEREKQSTYNNLPSDGNVYITNGHSPFFHSD